MTVQRDARAVVHCAVVNHPSVLCGRQAVLVGWSAHAADVTCKRCLKMMAGIALASVVAVEKVGA